MQASAKLFFISKSRNVINFIFVGSQGISIQSDYAGLSTGKYLALNVFDVSVSFSLQLD